MSVSGQFMTEAIQKGTFALYLLIKLLKWFFFAWKNNFKHVLVFKEAGSSTNFPSDLPAIFSHLVNKNSKTLEI